MIKRNENTTYLCIFGRRYILRDGTYMGWYNPNLKKVV